jgi:hypothetical protein
LATSTTSALAKVFRLGQATATAQTSRLNASTSPSPSKRITEKSLERFTVAVEIVERITNEQVLERINKAAQVLERINKAAEVAMSFTPAEVAERFTPAEVAECINTAAKAIGRLSLAASKDDTTGVFSITESSTLPVMPN